MIDQHLLRDVGETLFATNEHGRLVGAAPMLHILRTATDVLVRCHADLDDGVADTLAQIAMRPRDRPGRWSREYAALARALAGVEPLRAIRSGMLFGFPEGVSGHGGPVAICEDNADLLFGGLDEWRPDVANRLPMAAMVVDGRAVSVCSSVRASQSVHCAGVETVPEHRGRGLAAKAVAAWATMVEATGATPIYGTTFDNLSSQGVIRTLRLQLVASEFSVE